ncbi:MAG: anthranilate synthase component II [Cellulosilyticaceae bacterium]
MILIVDNYDSFTYNLYQYIGEIVGGEAELLVVRNDQLAGGQIDWNKVTHIVISPGPKGPWDAGDSLAIVRQFGGKIPILGVCLGHQVIGACFGGKIEKARRQMHGKCDTVQIDEACKLFKGLGFAIEVGRYHSLVINDEQLPEVLCVTAISQEGEIMGVMHKEYPIYGIQFHPESILTPSGKQILRNFLEVI